MTSYNRHLLLDLLAHHLRADVVEKQNQMASLRDKLKIIELLIKEERFKMIQVLGNYPRRLDIFIDIHHSRSALIEQMIQFVQDLWRVNDFHSLSSETLCNIEHLQHEARSARGLG